MRLLGKATAALNGHSRAPLRRAEAPVATGTGGD